MIINDITINPMYEQLVHDDLEAFNYQSLAKSQCNAILTTHTPPFVYAVCAPWGAGKSSFMRFVVKELNKDKSNKLLYINAWYESAQGNITEVFAKRLVEQLKYLDLDTVKTKSLIPMGSMSSRPWSQKISMSRKSFEEFCELITAAKFKPFVIIDELDRCKPDDVVSLLEAIRMYFSGVDELEREIFDIYKEQSKTHNNPFRFLLAIDEAYIGRCFEDHHGLDKDESQIYLSKFIQYRYHFPKKDFAKYVNLIVSWQMCDPNCMPSGTESDLTKLANGLDCDSIREMRRVFMYLLSYQEKFYSKDGNMSLLKKIEDATKGPNENRIKDCIFRMLNVYLSLFGAIKVVEPRLVPDVLNKNLIEDVAKGDIKAREVSSAVRDKKWWTCSVDEQNIFWLSKVINLTADITKEILEKISTARERKSCQKCAAECIVKAFQT